MTEGARGFLQSFEALSYKPKGRGFVSRLGLLRFFIDLILRAAVWPWGYTQPVAETGGGGGWQPVHRAGNLATFMCRLSKILNLLEPSDRLFQSPL